MKMEENMLFSNAIQKEDALSCLQKKGFRITKQRRTLIDVIFDGKCSSCKEIYYLASQKMPEIGIATVYRMLDVLEDVGAIKRHGAFQFCSCEGHELHTCEIYLDNDRKIQFDQETLYMILQKGMESYAYIGKEKIKKVVVEN